MADTARGNIAPIRLRVRRMTSVTAVMRDDAAGNRHRNAATQRRAVTSDAASLWASGASHVLGVIELHIETLFEAAGKSLSGRVVAIHTRVTDRTHGRAGRTELCSVAADAVLVAREAGLG